MKKKKYTAGQIICEDGSKGTEFFVIRSGKVRVFKEINNEKIELGTIGEDDVFGEMSMLLDSHRTASIQALEDTEVIILDKVSVLEEIKTHPEFAIVMLTRLAKRLTQAHSLIAKFQGEKKSLEVMYGELVEDADKVIKSILK